MQLPELCIKRPVFATVMSLMIVLGVSIKLIQEGKADNAAAKLKAIDDFINSTYSAK